MVTLQFDGLTFNSRAGSGLLITGLEGWWDGPDPRLELENRPQDDGSFDPGRIFRGPKVTTVTGAFYGASLYEAQQMRLRLAALQSAAYLSDFTVTDETGTFTAPVALASSPTLPDVLYSTFFSFTFDVSSPSSFKFGVPVSSSTGLSAPGAGVMFPVTFPINFGALGSTGRASVANPGTAAAWPVFSVTGGLVGGFQLTSVETGQRVIFARDIPVGSTVTVDSKTGQALLDGSPVPGFYTRSEWWSVPAGGVSTVQFAANGAVTGTPSFTLTAKPSYF